MLIEQIIDLNWGAWASWQNIYSYNWLFSWQNKNISEKSSSGLLFTA